jgi:hypothetical protein
MKTRCHSCLFCWFKGAVGKRENQRNNEKFMAKKMESSQRGALKMREARQYLGGISIPTIHRLIKRGLLRPNKCTRHLLFPIAELDRFLTDGMR